MTPQIRFPARLPKTENTFVAGKGRFLHLYERGGSRIHSAAPGLIKNVIAFFMGASALQLAKRLFVKLLLAFASQYAVVLDLNRDSPDAEVLRAFRRIAKKVHPDKGGRKEDAQAQNDAKDHWEQLSRKGQKAFEQEGDTEDSNKAHRGAKVRLWQIPAKSPDLNPVERFWSWLRRALRRLDLKDALATPPRPVPTKEQHKARVRAVLKSRRAQEAAGSMARGLRNVCKLIVKKKGEHSGK